MLLIANSRNTTKYGTILELWHVGSREPKIIQRPFDPFFYSLIRLPNSQPLEMRLLESLDKKSTIYKREFPDIRDLEKARDRAYTFMDDFPYIQLVAAKLGFKVMSPQPQHRTFDIEMDKGRLIGCGWSKEKEREVFTGQQDTILCNLNDAINDENPDVLDTYWGSYFDVGRLQAASQQFKIPLAWGRDGSEPWIWRKQYSHGPKRGYKNEVKIRGRIHFDVFNEVEMDQTLSGIKNKRLQTVAEWFKLGESSKIDHAHLLDYGMEIVKSECLEDVRKTWHLAEHYLQNLYSLADEYLFLPLNLLVDRSPSHVANYIYTREYEKIGVTASLSNAERYKQFFVWERKSYEGAFCKLYNPGIYGKLWKIDYRSMYPSIMGCHNLDPLTVMLLGIKYVQPPGWIVQFDDDKTSIYDKNLKGIFTVSVDVSEDSVSRKKIKQFMQWRTDVRAAMLSETQKESRQWAIKIQMNQLYGYHGMRYARLGCAPIAAYVTGIGRWWLLSSVQHMQNSVETVIEVDTDGIYIVGDGPAIAKETEDYIKSLTPSRYDSSFIKVTAEEFDSGIFYEEKGYVLQKGKSLKFHGSGLLGRHHPKVCDRVLEEVVNGIFANQDIKEILWKYTKLKQYPFEDFVMTIELHKVPEQYKEGTMIKKMLNEIDNVELGMEIQYVKTKAGFKPIASARHEQLDYNYYRGRIAESLSCILKPTKRLAASTIEKMIKEGQMIF